MNNETENFLEEMINKHDFLVKVTLDPEDTLCVMAEFAGRKQAYYRIVVDDEGEVYGIAYWSSLMVTEGDDESGGFEEFIPLRAFAIRTYIVCDIFRQCRALDLSYEIIRFFSLEGERVEFTNLLKVPMEDSDAQAEKLVEQCMSAILNEDVDTVELCKMLEKEGLVNTFNVLRATLV